MKICSKHGEYAEKRCKSCNREYQQKWFAENKQVQIGRVKANTEKQRNRLRAIVTEHLSSHPCIDCGESDPIVLDFDHVDTSTKKMSVAQVLSRGCAEEILLEEISKCEVRCSNCHRRRTAKQFDTWRYRAFS